VPVRRNEIIRVHCTYDNITDDWVYWGESSYDEMCFASIFIAPKIGIDFGCTN
jgi:hypothetical protein